MSYTSEAKDGAESCGNFNAVLRLLVDAGDLDLADHLKNSSGPEKYFAWSSPNDFIHREHSSAKDHPRIERKWLFRCDSRRSNKCIEREQMSIVLR